MPSSKSPPPRFLTLVTRKPFDCNQNGTVDVADPICVLRHLFLNLPPTLPCGDGTAIDPSNVSLFDWNGDSVIDLSDSVAGLLHLFLGGNPHVLGPLDVCVPIEDCTEICRP